MSNSSEENTDERGFISDDELPEDLRPSENPLARDPEDSDDPDDPDGTDASPGGSVPGMPDLGDPS